MTFATKVDWKTELEKIKYYGSMGYTYQTIANRYGVSRERIRQVISKHIPEWHGHYGHAARRNEREENYYKKWGEKQSTDLYDVQRQKFRAKKANATREGWEWSLDFGDLKWPSHCPIFGIELDYYAESRQENSPSFDQIDPGKGYVTGNVQIISWRANRIKNNGTAEEHRKIADYLDSIST